MPGLSHKRAMSMECAQMTKDARRWTAWIGWAFAALWLLASPVRATDVPSFPGAEGFGATTPGGRGGPVLVVTSLGDEGHGTLRWALEETSGPRIVVFRVGGLITLRRQIEVNGRVTVLGQTAPGGGVTIEGARLRILGDDVVIRGLRLRPGRGPGQHFRGRDGLTVGREEIAVRRVVIDHNSITWSPDENVSTFGPVEDVTISNNIMAEGLRIEGRQGMALLLTRGGRRLSVHGNLFASNWARNPQVARIDGVEIVNNLMVNYGVGGVEINTSPARIDVIGNVFVPGPDTVNPSARPPIAIQTDEPDLHVFLSDNITPMGVDVARGRGDWRVTAARVAGGSGLAIRPAAQTQARVLAFAGARTPELDAIDARIVAAAAVGGGAIKDAPPEAPLSFAAVATVEADTDGDGVPDAAERRLGSDPATADSHRLAPGSAYAFVELYGESLLPPRR
jgi:hypothetical protein